MTITFRCPNCETSISVQASDVHGPVACPACRGETALNLSDELRYGNRVDICPGCENGDFYVQRDFNQRLGFGVMLFFALLGLLFVWLDRPFFFYYSLGVGALVDLILYLMLPEITVCYSCGTTFRKVERNPAHGPFDLHVSDMYGNLSKQ